MARTLGRRARSEPIADQAGACVGAAAARDGARRGSGSSQSNWRFASSSGGLSNFEGHVSEPEHDHPDRVHYVPSPAWMLPRVLRLLGVSDRDTLVDFGCGKGRVVHQAAKRPFRRVIGVEISPALAEIARTNLATRRHQHRCPNVEIVVADAKEFRVPDDLTIAYFWHPFMGETFEAVLRRIVDSIDRHPRRVRSSTWGPGSGGARDREISALAGAPELEGRGWPIAIFESLERAEAPGPHRREARRAGSLPRRAAQRPPGSSRDRAPSRDHAHVPTKGACRSRPSTPLRRHRQARIVRACPSAPQPEEARGPKLEAGTARSRSASSARVAVGPTRSIKCAATAGTLSDAEHVAGTLSGSWG